jgi:hypothetical protein
MDTDLLAGVAAVDDQGKSIVRNSVATAEALFAEEAETDLASRKPLLFTVGRDSASECSRLANEDVKTDHRCQENHHQKERILL